METLYDMVTTRAAQAINVRQHRLEVGAPANLVVLKDGKCRSKRCASTPFLLRSISHGKLLDLQKMRHEAGAL